MGQNLKNILKAEFQLKNFLLDHRNPTIFIQFQCGRRKLYTVWRLFGVCLCVSLVATSLVLSRYSDSSPTSRFKWFIFLTNWSLLALLVNAVLDLSVSTYIQLKRKDLITGECHKMPWYLKADWVMYNIAESAAFAISVMYWTMLYKPGHSFEGYRIVGVLSHGLNSAYALVNLIVSGIPTRMLHIYQPIIYAIFYMIFSILYHSAGGTNDVDEPFIYSLLDWSKPTKAVLVSLGGVILGLGMHIFVYFVSLLRRTVAAKYYRSKPGCIYHDDTEQGNTHITTISINTE